METSVPTSFGDLLKRYRKQQKLTQQQLARKVDLHQNTVGAWERGDYLPATRGMILELARCLHLHEADTHRLLEASLLAVMFYWGLPTQRNPFFTGRQEILHHLHLLLARTQDRTSPRVCALNGIGGIGKTQTAIEYAHGYARDYTAVLWINAETEESLLTSFASIACMLKLLTPPTSGQQDVVTPVLSWLALHRDWLLIFDDVRECTLVQRFVPISRHGALLFTTRLPTLGTLAPCLQLQPLSLEESMQLLLSRAETRMFYQHTRSISSDETLAVRAIAMSMSGLPLALDLAAGYIEEAQCRFVEFLALYRHNLLQALQVHPSSATYPYSVERMFTLALGQLQQQNPLAADLLRLCCFFVPDQIPEVLLVRGAPYLNEELLAAISDPRQIQRIFKDLLSHALLQRDAQSETLRVHRLVQAVVQGQMSEATRRLWTERLIHLLDQLFFIEQEQRDPQHWAWYELLLPHIQYVLHLAEHWPIASVELASLLCKTATYLCMQTRRAIAAHAQASEPAYLESACAAHTLASLHGMERYREAELLALRALSIYEQKQTPGPHGLAHLLEELTRPQQSGPGVISLYEKGDSSLIQESDGQRREPWILQAREVQAPRQMISLTGWQTIPVAVEREPDGNSETRVCEMFLQECCTFSGQACCRAADLWRAYQAWAHRQEADVSPSRQTLTSCLKAKGCSPARTNTSRSWHGLDLKIPLQRETHSGTAGRKERDAMKLPAKRARTSEVATGHRPQTEHGTCSRSFERGRSEEGW
jgi:transcriptional regulator with XRE-family HTH domain